jgi:chorismate dehydratase
VRIGAVTYLNTRPLVYGLEEDLGGHELIYDLPSRLADRLANSELDVALIPSIEFLRRPDYTIVSDACIACRGPVLSVKLFSRVPLSKIQTLMLDEGSRTSVAMVKILLWERFGIAPQTFPLPMGLTLEQTSTDAVLLIGDRAIHAQHAAFPHVWDLGDEWCRFTELPFVFAVWTARPGIEVAEMSSLLSSSRDIGMSLIETIVDREAVRYGLTYDACREYFRRHLHFYFGPREKEGLKLFARHAAKLGEISLDPYAEFHDCSIT